MGSDSLHAFYHVRFFLFNLRSSVVFTSKYQAMAFCDLMDRTYSSDFVKSEIFIQEY